MKSVRTIKTGSRPWDQVGEESAKIASEVGQFRLKENCCLVIAGYDIRYNLAKEVLAGKRNKSLLRPCLWTIKIFLNYTTIEGGCPVTRLTSSKLWTKGMRKFSSRVARG